MKFEKQTYTQTPNSLFVEMKNMDECELKVVLLICRYTFGYHRDEVKLSTRRIANEIGMSTVSVAKGADRAVERGLIEKITDGQNTTVWRALVSDSESDTPVIQKVNHGDSESEPQVGVKEKKNKPIKKVKEAAPPQPPEILLFREVVRHYPKQAQRELVIDAMQKIKARLFRDVSLEDLQPFWLAWCKVSGNEWSLVWLEWCITGVLPTNGKQANINENKSSNFKRTEQRQPTQEDATARAVAERILSRRAEQAANV